MRALVLVSVPCSRVADHAFNHSLSSSTSQLALHTQSKPVPLPPLFPLYDLPFLPQWMESRPNNPQCPVCKSAIERDRLIPLYGRGANDKEDPRYLTTPTLQVATPTLLYCIVSIGLFSPHGGLNEETQPPCLVLCSNIYVCVGTSSNSAISSFSPSLVLLLQRQGPPKTTGTETRACIPE